MKSSAPTIWELESDANFLSPRVMRIVVIGGLVALYAIALLLIARRMMGALTAELPWQTVAATTMLSFALVSGLRVLWWRACSEPLAAKPQAAWVGWGASLILVLIAGAISFPRGNSQTWLLWLPVLAADQWLRWRMFGKQQVTESVSAKPSAMADRGRTAGSTLQQIVRTRDAVGMETVTATLRADFVVGQRNATVYVGFCPPLSRVPDLTIEPVDGADAKVVQAFAHGVRIDVRLAQAARGASSVAVNVVAKT
jgi:hypothetical protein